MSTSIRSLKQPVISYIEKVEDQYARVNFKQLQEFITSNPIFNPNFQFFTITFQRPEPNFKFLHNLGYVPRDIIQTSLIGPGTLVFNYDLFDVNFIDITVAGAVTNTTPQTVRFYAGTYK